MSEETYGMTKQQARLKAFIVAYAAEHGYSPTFQEMADGLGLASKSGIVRLMRGLAHRGHVRFRPGTQRSVEVIA